MKKYLDKSYWKRLSPQGALAACVGDCGSSHWTLMDPMGPIGADEKRLIFIAFGLMLTVVIPVIVMALSFAWKYRASNTAATYAPKWDYSGKIETVVWVVPTVIVLILSVLVWRESHALSPYKPIASSVKPIEVEAVSLDWKWLFIYPDLGIASVNKLVFPSGTPVNFRITSDSVMTSFFIPQLGSQIYAMAGMQTKLHLVADQPGTYRGLNSQFSGDGFSGMHFDAVATSGQGFADWVKEVKQSRSTLDGTGFAKLEIPSENTPVQYFARVKPGLFDDVIMKYMPDMAPRAAAGKDMAQNQF
jgi:cytochrome o ubiquinol oxidase subunit 2